MMADSGEGDNAVSVNNSTSNQDGDNQAANPDQNGQVNQAAEEQPAQGGWAMMKGFLFRMLIIYAISSFFRRGQNTQTTDPNNPDAPAKSPCHNLFLKDSVLDMYIYVSEQETFTDFDNKDALFWSKFGLVYGDWTSGPNGDGSFIQTGQIQTPVAVQNNGTIYLHAYFVSSGKSPNPSDKGRYAKKFTIYKKRQLNKYKKRRYHTNTNLLTGETEVHPDLVKKENSTVTFDILSHWHENLTINLLDDHTPWIKGSIPPPLDDYVEFLPHQDNYYPVLFFNDYWNLNSDFQPVNETTKVLNFSLTYSPISLIRWQMYAAQGMRSKWYSVLGEDMFEESDEDQDSLKRTLVETNPYLLGLTVVISIVHSVFEFLAFKNDIQFWNNRKSLEGLSVRSVFFNVFQSLVVVLYVMDNETNFVVRISVCIGLLIEIWKIHKVVDIKVDRENKWFGVIPRIGIADKSTYTQSETKKFDQMAFKYLSVLLFPLLVGYAVYALIYQEHKGWYSFTLNMVYGFLLTFGFIMMTPQLFINYKMKSVAHLPWRMMTYKALNTFIDDIFAFVIKMPMLYRIGCFRDDIVFLIFLYQRWIYPVDPTRVNEYGTSAEMFDQNGQIIPQNQETSEAEGDGTPKPVEEKKND